MPGHVLRIPPGVLQALPEQARLPDAPNLVPPRDDSLFAILHDQLAQRVHQVRPQLFEPLVVRPQRQLRQRFLRTGRGLLAVNPQRRARGMRTQRGQCAQRGLRALRGLRAVKWRNVAVVRRLILAIQNGEVVQIVHLSRHKVFMKCDVAQASSLWHLATPRLDPPATNPHRLEACATIDVPRQLG